MRARWLFGLVSLSGCGSRVGEVVARPSTGATEVGDANADGVVDIADAVFIERFLFGGGAAPPCEAAANVAPNTLIEAGDGFAVLGYLFLGYAEHPRLDAALCPAATGLPDPEPARFGFEILPPAKGDTVATVVVHAPDAAAQAWSFGVRATGCGITAATTAGTVAADSFDGGRVDVGFARTDVVDGGAVSAVMLSWKHDAALGPGEEAFPVLKLDLAGAVGCECALHLGSDVVGADRPVELVIASGGRSFRPAEVDASFKVCP